MSIVYTIMIQQDNISFVIFLFSPFLFSMIRNRNILRFLRSDNYTP